MKIYSAKYDKFIDTIKQRNEKELQKFLINKWERFFPHLQFIKTEFYIKQSARSENDRYGRIDILAFNPKSSCFVIFELKRDRGKNIIHQAADYAGAFLKYIETADFYKSIKEFPQLPEYESINKKEIELILIDTFFSEINIENAKNSSQNKITLIKYAWIYINDYTIDNEIKVFPFKNNFDNYILVFEYVNNEPKNWIKLSEQKNKERILIRKQEIERTNIFSKAYRAAAKYSNKNLIKYSILQEKINKHLSIIEKLDDKSYQKTILMQLEELINSLNRKAEKKVVGTRKKVRKNMKAIELIKYFYAFFDLYFETEVYFQNFLFLKSELPLIKIICSKQYTFYFTLFLTYDNRKVNEGIQLYSELSLDSLGLDMEKIRLLYTNYTPDMEEPYIYPYELNKYYIDFLIDYEKYHCDEVIENINLSDSYYWFKIDSSWDIIELSRYLKKYADIENLIQSKRNKIL